MRMQLENVWEGRGTCLLPRFLWQHPRSHLLHRRQALELGAAEVLLLQGCRLQHEVLLLGCIHLLQVLGRRAGLPVQGLLDHLRGVRWGREEPLLRPGLFQPLPPNDQVCDPHSPGSGGDSCLHSSTRSDLSPSLFRVHAPCSFQIPVAHASLTTLRSGERRPVPPGPMAGLLVTPPRHSTASDEGNRTIGVMMTEGTEAQQGRKGERDGKKERQVGSGGLFQPAKLKPVQGQHPSGRVCPQLLRGPTGPSGDCLSGLAEQGCYSHRDATGTRMLLQP